MLSDFNLDAVIDALAEKVAVKVCDHLARDSRAAGMQPRLMTVEQAAVYLGRTPEAVQHMIAAGKIPTVRADRRVFLDREDLDGWIQQNKA